MVQSTVKAEAKADLKDAVAEYWEINGLGMTMHLWAKK